MLHAISKRLLPALLFPALVSSALAADIVVNPGDDLQAAIVTALDGDRVLVQPGTYVGQIDFLGKAIDVVGVQGAELTVLDGASTGPVVRFANGEGNASRLIGITVTGGFANFGAGGINCGGSLQPTIEDCIIQGNRGKFGGGISGSPILRRCQILQNTASLTHGGGVYGAPQLFDCVVVGNSATSADGGGLYIQGINTTSVIDNCLIADNQAVFANSHGGGIYVDSPAKVVITNSVIAGNLSTGGAFNGRGGGIAVEAAGSSLTNCTVAGNTVSGSSTLGAGAYGPLTMLNSIVWGNLGGPQISSATLVSYTDVEGGFAGVGNIAADPLFFDAAADDYHLLAGSPCIDAGDPTTKDPDGSIADMGAFPFSAGYDPTAVEFYCTAKASSAGCLAALASSAPDHAPISGQLDYTLFALDLQGMKSGIFFFGTSGPAALPFSGGTLCVLPPTGRTPLQFSGGSSPTSCDGSFNLIVNDGSSAFDVGAGNTVWIQSWYRDPANGAGTLGTALSNAVALSFQ